LSGSTTGRILSILSGTVVFALLILLNIPLQYALIGGVMGWLAFILIYSRKESNEEIVVDGLTRSDMENTIKTGRKLTAGMRLAVKKLSQIEISQEVEDLCRIAESMFEMLRKDPKDILSGADSQDHRKVCGACNYKADAG
jgi:5-bromo-4-chloroindolyl phosphate hydrolysis protein